jgi:hypothetical protein
VDENARLTGDTASDAMNANEQSERRRCDTIRGGVVIKRGNLCGTKKKTKG